MLAFFPKKCIIDFMTTVLIAGFFVFIGLSIKSK